MDLTFAYDTYYLILLNLTSIVILLIVNTAIWLKAKKTPLLYTYLVTQGLLLIWMVFKIFKTLAPNTEMKFLLVVLQYVGICFLGGAFFVFAFLYRYGRLPAVKHLVLLGIIPVISLGFLITNPLHFLFYSHFDFWGDSFGSVFYIHQAYNYILILAGIFLCVGVYRRQANEKRISSFLFSVAIIIPLIANILYVFGWLEPLFGFSPPCDITPISCNLSLMLFALATFRYSLFDDIRIARKKALFSVPDGILLLDRDMRITDYNDTFRKLYQNGLLSADGDKGVIEDGASTSRLVLHEKADFISLPPEEIHDMTYETREGSYYRVLCQPAVRNGMSVGFSLRFIDITLMQVILDNMERKNKALVILNERLEEQTCMCRSLAVARTRNLIASEAHDVLGHSVVLVISILEVARLSMENQGFRPEGAIARAAEILKDCFEKSAILGNAYPVGSAGRGLTEKIENLISEAKSASVWVELTISGELPDIPAACEEEIFRLCREGITNAIRHGKADKIDIILRPNPQALMVYVIDNGKGCKEVNKGLGIKGIEDRITLLGGTLACGSFGSRGFCLRADIPVKSIKK